MMNGREKSDSAIVAMKPANKAGKPAAEWVEPRAGTKGNTDQQSTRRAQNRASVSQGWNVYGKLQGSGRRRRFTALLHHVTIDRLRESFFALKRNAAPGVDGMTWRDYEAGSGEHLRGPACAGPKWSVPGTAQSGGQYIPKPDGQQRPLGIAALEDKIVQRAVVEVLNAIYEEDFLGFSYGFRPGRSQHDALDALAIGITSTPVNWILDADIRSLLGSCFILHPYL